jgi:HEPN domain-containing protein
LNKHTEEWIKQAEYDMGIAEFLFNGAKYSYTVFKGLYVQILNEEPPKIHNLVYFVEKLTLNPPDDLLNFLVVLNRMNIATRYPDELEKMLKEYNKDKTKKLLIKSKETLEWIKTQLQMPSDS